MSLPERPTNRSLWLLRAGRGIKAPSPSARSTNSSFHWSLTCPFPCLSFPTTSNRETRKHRLRTHSGPRIQPSAYLPGSAAQAETEKVRQSCAPAVRISPPSVPSENKTMNAARFNLATVLSLVPAFL